MNHGKLCQCSACQPIEEPKIRRVIWFDDGNVTKVEAVEVYHYNNQWFIVGELTFRSGYTGRRTYTINEWNRRDF